MIRTKRKASAACRHPVARKLKFSDVQPHSKVPLDYGPNSSEVVFSDTELTVHMENLIESLKVGTEIKLK